MFAIKEALLILVTIFIAITSTTAMLILTACSGHHNGFQDLHPESKEAVYTSLKLLGVGLIIGVILLLI